MMNHPTAATPAQPLDIVFDMETDDPDDFLTLLLLLGHPRARLRAVTIVPGSPEQVGLVRAALGWFGADLPVGVFNPRPEKPAVSPWHAAAYGAVAPAHDAEGGAEVLLRTATPQTALLVGGPLRNVQAAIQLAAVRGAVFAPGRVVIQGGFAGTHLVPPERQLPRFHGLETAVSHNLSKHSKSALAALAHPGFGERRLVSKNVCHRALYDRELHARIAPLRPRSRSLDLIWQGMEVYLRERPDGKLLHDPLAACCALDPGVASWAEVEVYSQRGEWGARPAPGSGTWITVDYDPDRFEQLLTEVG
ncbi:MAG TPA: nucleoside hydrolase [Roseiflexaceae bacterium]|nr:nucleoside hydrolase [Roseiflexaceae bacterium]